jgi:FkbM family methyltransferase
MKQMLKRYVVHGCPSLVAAYHTFRSARETFRHPTKPTPFGFSMKGHGSMQRGDFERGETALVRELLPRVSTFVDVGANVGFFSCLARQAGLHVVAVEPSAQNLDLLLGNLTENGWTDVEVYPVALAREPGIATLYGEGTGASMVRRWSGTSEVWRRLVPVSTLDVLLDNRFPGERLMIKIDVEGLEHAVLAGAKNTLTREPSPIWLLEVCLTEHHPGGRNPDFAAVFETFWRHGYEARTADSDNRLVRPEDVARWVAAGARDFGWINFFFTRNASA